MEKDLQRIRETAFETVKKAQNPDELEKARIEYLGRERGALTLILRKLKDLPPEERKRVGEEANRLREKIEETFAEKTEELKKTGFESILKKEWVDITRSGTRREQGHLHPLTKITREIGEIFSSIGFAIVEGPEVETEHYNFDALNIPENHPSRDMWDTLWLKPQTQNSKGKSQKLLLRTHTSPVQIRYMEKNRPPIRIIVPGRCYRYEATDASHDFQFHQLEGLMVDKTISIANFKAVIQEFFSRLFRTTVTVRLRPSYFPFVEPAFEVDISCIMCSGRGCSVCKKSGWLELAGAGMVHPKVFKAVGYNSREVQGFAFGFGIERLAMMKYKINDIRLFRSGDLRFLKQF